MNLFATVDGTVNNLDRPFYFGAPFDREWCHEFPILDRGPSREGFSEESSGDPTIRHEFESGAIQTRPRFTWVPKVWSFTIRRLSNNDKNTLQSFERDVVNYGSEEFRWGNTQGGATHRVKFAAPITYALMHDDLRLTRDLWVVKIRLIQAARGS